MSNIQKQINRKATRKYRNVEAQGEENSKRKQLMGTNERDSPLIFKANHFSNKHLVFLELEAEELGIESEKEDMFQELGYERR